MYFFCLANYFSLLLFQKYEYLTATTVLYISVAYSIQWYGVGDAYSSQHDYNTIRNRCQVPGPALSKQLSQHSICSISKFRTVNVKKYYFYKHYI